MPTARHEPVPGFDLDCRVEVVLARDGGWWRPAAAEPLSEPSASCFPRVSVDASGRLWLAHRSVRQLPFAEYVAHVAVRVHTGGAWSPPRLLPASDGSCTEIALAPRADGIAVAYHGDGHAARHVAMVSGAAPSDPPRRQEGCRGSTCGCRRG